jgi:hypothetical protein
MMPQQASKGVPVTLSPAWAAARSFFPFSLRVYCGEQKFFFRVFSLAVTLLLDSQRAISIAYLLKASGHNRYA